MWENLLFHNNNLKLRNISYYTLMGEVSRTAGMFSSYYFFFYSEEIQVFDKFLERKREKMIDNEMKMKIFLNTT